MVTARAIYSIHAADQDIPRAWAMYFGGSGSESGKAVASDAAGNAYIVAAIGSRDSPGGTDGAQTELAGAFNSACACGLTPQSRSSCSSL